MTSQVPATPPFPTMFTSKLTLISLFSSFLLTTASPLPSLGRRAAAVLADGRVPINFSQADFDVSGTSPFSPDFTRAEDQPFSQIVQLPNDPPSLFDGTTSRALEVTINDKSIFAPGGKPQNGFRRAELMLASNDGKDATVQGITTMHFSIKDDPAKPLDFNHEYQPVFIETSDFSSHVWTLKTGVPFGTDPTTVGDCEKKTLRLGSSTAGGADKEEVLFQTAFDSGVWHNYAIQTDWDKRHAIT